MKNFIWIGAAVIILIGLMFWGVNGGNTINPPFEVNVVHPLDHVIGNASSSVVVIEYSDFQCPACRSYYPITKQLVAEFGNDIAFVYRHFPLIEIHANAHLAAQASEAAAKQGKFWQMHDLLFEKQNEWGKVSDIGPLFESYATLAGVSVEQFKNDFTSKDVVNFVRAERSNAISLRLQGTPTFFVNGKQIQNPSSIEAFRAIIKDAIDAKP